MHAAWLQPIDFSAATMQTREPVRAAAARVRQERLHGARTVPLKPEQVPVAEAKLAPGPVPRLATTFAAPNEAPGVRALKRRRGQRDAAVGAGAAVAVAGAASSEFKPGLAPPKLTVKETAARKRLGFAAGDAKQRLLSELFAGTRHTTLPEDGCRVIEAWPEWVHTAEARIEKLRFAGGPEPDGEPARLGLVVCANVSSAPCRRS